jgi:hypothetical protein
LVATSVVRAGRVLTGPSIRGPVHDAHCQGARLEGLLGKGYKDRAGPAAEEQCSGAHAGK